MHKLTYARQNVYICMLCLCIILQYLDCIIRIYVCTYDMMLARIAASIKSSSLHRCETDAIGLFNVSAFVAPTASNFSLHISLPVTACLSVSISLYSAFLHSEPFNDERD